MQTELTMLEAELHRLDTEDAGKSDGCDRLRSWQSVQNSTNPDDEARKRVAVNMRSKLKEYSKISLQFNANDC